MRTRLLRAAASNSKSWVIAALSAPEIVAVLIGFSLLAVPGHFPDGARVGATVRLHSRSTGSLIGWSCYPPIDRRVLRPPNRPIARCRMPPFPATVHPGARTPEPHPRKGQIACASSLQVLPEPR